jgi:glycosyltransferase involved in cell wall biosynthesis
MSSESEIRYSIVVPFFNEQENIPPLYMKLTEVMDSIGEPFELVFVDDGSRDNTFRVLSEIYEHDRRVNLIRLRRNFGQTPALKAGFDFARGAIIISMDGDLQHDPEEIPRFLEKIEEGFDLVSGWRYARRDHWLMRQLPSRAANWMMATLAGGDLHDFGTTFKAYRRGHSGNSTLRREGHRFIPALANTGAKIAEYQSKIWSEKRQVQLRNRTHHPGVPGFADRKVPTRLFNAAAAILWLVGIDGRRFGNADRNLCSVPEAFLSRFRDARTRPTNATVDRLGGQWDSVYFDGITRRTDVAHLLRIAEQANLHPA